MSLEYGPVRGQSSKHIAEKADNPAAAILSSRRQSWEGTAWGHQTLQYSDTVSWQWAEMDL